MGAPVAFPGHNRTLAPPAGAENISALPIFGNGTCCVSCWQLTPEELAEVNASGGRVFISIFYGDTQPPVFVGAESATREVIADYGVWKKPTEVEGDAANGSAPQQDQRGSPK